MSAGYDLTHWRIPGVFQRFGITYFVVALTELLTAELYARWNVRRGGRRGECSRLEEYGLIEHSHASWEFFKPHLSGFVRKKNVCMKCVISVGNLCPPLSS